MEEENSNIIKFNSSESQQGQDTSIKSIESIFFYYPALYVTHVRNNNSIKLLDKYSPLKLY